MKTHPADRAPQSAASLAPLGATALVLALLSAIACGDSGGGDGPADADTGSDDRGGTPDVDVIPDHDPPAELAALVDYEALFDQDTLDIVVDRDRSGQVPGDFDEPIWQIGLTFRSQTFLGTVWSHSALLILPDDLSRADGSFAVLQQGTPNPIEDVSDSASFLPQFAAITADRLDMPVLMVSDPIPLPVDLGRDTELRDAFQAGHPDCFASPLRDEGTFTRCLWDLAEASQRPEIFPAIPVAVVYSRALTVMQDMSVRVDSLNLSFDPPSFRADRAALLASGLGGLALRYAMALDGRIAGVMTASADIGDFDDFFQAQQDAWLTGFAYGEPGERLEFLNGDRSDDFIAALALSRIAIGLRGRTFLTAVSTNDPTLPIGQHTDYVQLLPTDSAVLYVGGAPEGFGTLDHLFGWRVFLAHTFRGRAWASVETAFEDDAGNITVTATVGGDTLLQTVELFSVQRHSELDDADFRDAVWQRQTMTDGGGGTYTATFPNTNANTAFFVRVLDSQDIYEGPMTSELTVLTQ